MSNYTSAEMLGAAVILTFAIFLISKSNYAFFIWALSPLLVTPDNTTDSLLTEKYLDKRGLVPLLR